MYMPPLSSVNSPTGHKGLHFCPCMWIWLLVSGTNNTPNQTLCPKYREHSSFYWLQMKPHYWHSCHLLSPCPLWYLSNTITLTKQATVTHQPILPRQMISYINTFKWQTYFRIKSLHHIYKNKHTDTFLVARSGDLLSSPAPITTLQGDTGT